MHIANNLPKINVEQEFAEPPRREFLRLGAELFNRGQRPVAEFISELADLAPEIAAEIQVRLAAYTRIPTDIYEALGADRFVPYLIGIDGGQP